MCNPRRVHVRATRQLAQAWEEEIRRQVSRTGDVVGEARIREPLAAGIGAPTLTALTSVLERLPGWDWDGESFVHQLDGGHISFDPVTRELEIVARMSDRVAATGEARQTVGGTLNETVEAEGQGTYYDDGWGGLTAETAQAEAERNAAAAVDEAVAGLLARERAAADEREGAAVEAAAAAAADRSLAERSTARRTELEHAAAARLDAVGVQGRNLFHAALAEAYRDAILAYARARGADGIRCSEADGVLDIEFEMQA
jgi:hypothetical protein